VETPNRAWRSALSDLDIGKHIDLVAELLLVIADQFQEAMLTRLN
jgi:hypothetical protein